MYKLFNFGKIDFYGSGRRINPVEVEVRLSDKGVFTASATIWNSRHTDCVCAGQCLDEVSKHITSEPFKKIYTLWKKHHLNDMHAGTVKQEEALVAAGLTGFAADYKKCCEYLESIGLLVDDGYEFGTGWLKREIPAEDLQEIKNLLSGNNSVGYEIKNIDVYHNALVKEI